MSTIMVIGASGQTGRQVVQQALDKNIKVVAVVRKYTPHWQKHPNLMLRSTNYFDPLALQNLMGKFPIDCVYITVGSNPAEKEMVRTTITKSVTEAMQISGLRRVICMTTLGMGKTIEMLPMQMRKFIIPMFLKNSFKDHQLQEEAITSTDLDWTLVRPSNLTDGELTKVYQFGTENTKTIKGKISRADVADFMLKLSNDAKSIHQKYWISY